MSVERIWNVRCSPRAIRDSAAIRAQGFPVFAAGVTHRGPYKDGPGEINVPVKEILGRAGWREALDSETKGALAMGAMGLSALVLDRLG